MGDVKYAVVRVQGEQRMIDLFTLLVSNGYSDVSFVSSLANTILKTEPNSQTQDDSSTSRVTSSSSSTGAIVGSSASVSTTSVALQQPQQLQIRPTTPQQQLLLPKQQLQQVHQPQLQQEQRREKREESPLASSTKSANTLLQSLFERNGDEDGSSHFVVHQQPWVLPSGEIPAPSMHGQPPPMMMPMGLMMAPGGGFGGPCMSARSINYTGVDGSGRKMPFAIRMKGWQRKMLSEAMATGIPVGEELAALCLAAQVTEKQAMNFFRKRRIGQTMDGAFKMEDDGDGMRGESPDESAFVMPNAAEGAPMYHEPKVEDMQ